MGLEDKLAKGTALGRGSYARQAALAEELASGGAVLAQAAGAGAGVVITESGVGSPTPGQTRRAADNVTTKSYQYYSGSIINRDTFKRQGYQDSFVWENHRYVYMNQITRFDVTSTYTEVGTNTYTGLRDIDGVLLTVTEVEPIYAWVEQEHTPQVSLQFSSKEIFAFPGSIGIIAESEGAYAIDSTDGSSLEGKSHEMAFTSNSDIIFETVTDYGDTDGDGQTITLTSYLDINETNLIDDIFGFSMNGLSELQSQVETISRTIFDAQLVSSNVFPTAKPKEISQAFLTDIQAIETSFSASVAAPTTETSYTP